MTDISKAIKAINPTAEFSVNAEDYEQITWLNATPVISRENIETKLNELQAEYNALDYARAREKEYPSTKDFMEAYTEKEIGGSSGKWDAYVINYNKVRSDNPK